MTKVNIIGITTPRNLPDIDEPVPEDLIAYCARVSNPKNKSNVKTAGKLLGYLMEHAHWSPFEMVNIVVEIEGVPRDIGRQILRHRSFSFQEYSQRYAAVDNFTIREGRKQDFKNRQNSIALNLEDPSERELYKMWEEKQHEVLKLAKMHYNWALENGIAKECARVVLPEGLTLSTMSMNGTLRSWIHFCAPQYGIRRKEHGTQKENYEIAEPIWEAIAQEFPAISDFILSTQQD